MNFSHHKVCVICKNNVINSNNPRYASLDLICNECIESNSILDSNVHLVKITSKNDASRNLIIVDIEDCTFVETKTFNFSLKNFNCTAIDGIPDGIIYYANIVKDETKCLYNVQRGFSAKTLD